MTQTKTRVSHDRYYTDKKIADRLISVMIQNELLNQFDKIFEPCSGVNGIASAFKDEGHMVYTNDIDTTANSQYCLDATQKKSWEHFPICEWIVTNPPFKDAQSIIEHSWENCSKGMIMLLRLSWLEPIPARAKLLDDLSDHLTNIIPVNPRPKFRTDTKNTDSVTVAWLIWQRGFSWKRIGIFAPYSIITHWKD